MTLLLGIVGGLVAVLVVQFVHLCAVMIWCDQRTRGLGYYGLSRSGRQRLRRILRWHRRVLAPLLWIIGRTRTFEFAEGCFTVQGVAGPRGSCRPEDFERGARYQPSAIDVFVASQMKCGTTWLQHLVLQVLLRGQTDLSETGTALYELSPWLESSKTVSLDAAPLIGAERPSRLIKTHFPTTLCPYSPQAKYLYVVRHPVSCFASCVDFVQSNLAEFAPPLDEYEAWFRSSEQMWWGTWPAHVAGWWQWAAQRENVLLLRFEDMKQDLAAAAQQVARFLEVAPLDEHELASVLHHCSFQQMSEHADCFEMHPPHLLQTDGQFFVSGRATRYRDILPAMAARIARWSGGELVASGVPIDSLYPDLGEAAGPRILVESAAAADDTTLASPTLAPLS